ncbi:endospore germination permease [Paenibacillus sp. P25]|nr:endospore germination permease [Paenibacillus sp. P25]
MRKITMLQTAYLLMLSNGISSHVIVLPILLQTAGRDAWISVVCSAVPLVIWIILLYSIAKSMQGQSFADWLRQKLPVPVAWALTGFFAMYLYAIAFISLKDTVNWTKTAYLPNTPLFVLSVSFGILCIFASGAGIRALAVTAGILLPFVLLLGLFVMTVNFQFKDYSLLLPLFTHGYLPALKSMAYEMGSFCELVVLLFIQPHLAGKVRLVPLMVLAFILLELTLGPLMGAIAMFGPFEAAAQRYPAFEQWRMVSMGKFFTHLDFFSIYQWLSGSFIRISLALFLIADLLKLGKKEGRRSLYLRHC